MNNSFKMISVHDFVELTQGSDKIALIDVRTVAEVNHEYLEGGINLPFQDISASAIKTSLAHCGCNEVEPVYLLCSTGQRALKAAEQLKNEVCNPLVIIEGGINEMKQKNVGSLRRGSGIVISLERQVRIAAGSLTLLGVGLGALLNPVYYTFSAFIAVGLIFAGVTNTCGMGIVLARMPWNR